MRNKRLQNRITAGRFTLPTAIILSLFGWMLTSALLPEMPATESGYSLWQTVCSSYIPTWANTPLSFILYLSLIHI